MRAYHALNDAAYVSVLFNEPKLLKSTVSQAYTQALLSFSALQRAEIAEIEVGLPLAEGILRVSVLFNEPKLLKSQRRKMLRDALEVSVLFNEPKLLKLMSISLLLSLPARFSALQRAEIAEISQLGRYNRPGARVSVLFNEPKLLKFYRVL